MESTAMRYLIYSTTTLIVLFSLFYAYAKYKLSYWSRRGVKSPPTHLFFGNFKDMFTMRTLPNQLMDDLYNNSDPDDPYVGFYIFHKPMLLIKDHNMIKEVMIKNFDIFPNRRFGSANGTDAMGLSNLLAITSPPAWKYLRNKLTPALTGQRLKNAIPLITDRGKLMLNYIEGLPVDADGHRTTDSILNICSRCVNDILTCLFFGVHTNSFDEEHDEFWRAGINFFRGFIRSIVFLIYFFVPTLIPLIEPFIKNSANFFRKCFCNSMETREKTGVKRGDLIDFMLTLKNEEQNPIFKFEGDNLLAQVISFYIAGFEATGTSVANALFHLASYPDYQTALYNEIEEYLSGKEINIELLNELSFLDCVVNESLRLSPAIPVTDRTAEDNFKLPGSELVIEKGTPVYVSITGTNQDPKYFSNPLEFNPYRTQMENKRFYESLAFGIGPRSCIGQRLAISIAKLIIIMIISNYELSCEEKKNKPFSYHIFSYQTDNFNIHFKKRDKSAQA